MTFVMYVGVTSAITSTATEGVNAPEMPNARGLVLSTKGALNQALNFQRSLPPLSSAHKTSSYDTTEPSVT